MKLIFILLVLVSCHSDSSVKSVSVSSETGISPAVPDETSSELNELMILINTHRLTLGLKSLILSEDLSELSRLHSEDMANKLISFGHDGFSARCADGRRILEGGNLCAENVAMGQKNPINAFSAWINSSGHRTNLEGTRFTHTGLGLATSPTGVKYWTQLFLEKKN